LGLRLAPPPATTAIGALLSHITGGHLSSDPSQNGNAAGDDVALSAGAGRPRSFQPMNVNFGLFPPVTEPVRGEAGERLRGAAKSMARRRAMSARALRDLAEWACAIGERRMASGK
jgi:methylenetetrahydrofolate--tRNA-(uracil-5-)-methyltransferase